MSSEKTEEPSDKKLSDARRRGEVAHSKDFTQTVLILALFAYLLAGAASTARDMASWLTTPMLLLDKPFESALSALVVPLVEAASFVLLPFLGIVLGIGVFAETLQVGVLLSFEAIKPSAKKLNVASNAKNMVSKKNLMEFVKNCIKVAALSAVAYEVIRSRFGYLMTLSDAGLVAVGEAVVTLVKVLIINISMPYLVLALADLVWQRRAYRKGLMMSKDERKREYRESEGDPHIKGARREFHKELLESNMAENTRKASVVITNPTHIAVALFYDDAATPLPVVLAKGTRAVARRIVEIAKEEGIPVMQNVPLARALNQYAAIEQYVPTDLLEPIAEILRAVKEIAAAHVRRSDG